MLRFQSYLIVYFLSPAAATAGGLDKTLPRTKVVVWPAALFCLAIATVARISLFFVFSYLELHVFHVKMSERRAKDEAKMAAQSRKRGKKTCSLPRGGAIQSDESLQNDTRDIQNHFS